LRAIKILLTVLVAVVLLLSVGVFLLNRYVQSAAFKLAALNAARHALGSEVTVSDVRVSLFTGATLERVAIANPPGFSGDLLSADALVVRYRLLPLLRRRLEMEQLSLERPVLRLARDDRGEWNYEKVGPRPAHATVRSTPRASGPSDAPSSPTVVPALDIVLPKLTANRGEIVMADERNRPLARVQQLELASSLKWAGGALTGNGKADIETLNVADTLFVKRLATAVSFSSSELRLGPLSGTLADGDVLGDLTLRLAGGFRYAVNVHVKNADVEQLLQEAGAKRRAIRGKLQGQATLEGTGGLPTIVGKGRAEILSGTVIDVPLLNMLATLLQVPALRDLRCEECRLEFALSDNVLQTPVIRLVSHDVRITGQGAVSLATSSLNHQLTLALTRRTLDRAPRDIRAAFTERPDGLLAVDFRVWGAYDSPRTDLQDRVLKRVTEQFLRRGLRKLFQ